MTIANDLWQRFHEYLYQDRELGFALDISRMNFASTYFPRMEQAIGRALTAMADLEQGAIANRDENRMVGHYWLRDAQLAPPSEQAAIRETKTNVQEFARRIRAGAVTGAGGAFSDFLLVGIGGSMLGPQFVADALGDVGQPLSPHYLDNTDPDGIARAMARLAGRLDRTLVVVTSKSGGTPETRNGMLEAKAAFARANVPFAPQAVAITQTGSALDRQAQGEAWLARFPMWDWVGGRTSVMSAVGLLPAALQGIAIDDFLEGAAHMDRATRAADYRRNPAALLALMWYHATLGRGAKDMVVLPYKDRLQLFSKYLQQLIMESLGKELDRAGLPVYQGIAVYGNKGSTDQHSYIQQLRDGVPNFFATFVEVLRDVADPAHTVDVGNGVTAGDYLSAFYLGTRQALYESGRESMTITINEVSARTVGALIALFERAVGLYAELININAYHQPGVEAGKKAAASVLELQGQVLNHLRASGAALTASALADAIGQTPHTETVYKILEHLAANAHCGVMRHQWGSPSTSTYRATSA